jgi:hypothetical protein
VLCAAGALLAAGGSRNASDWAPGNATAWEHQAGGPGEGLFSAHPADRRTKASALQRLKDLAPLTLFSDWGDQGGVAAAWQATPGTGPGRSPLLPPMQCREVAVFSNHNDCLQVIWTYARAPPAMQCREVATALMHVPCRQCWTYLLTPHVHHASQACAAC